MKKILTSLLFPFSFLLLPSMVEAAAVKNNYSGPRAGSNPYAWAQRAPERAPIKDETTGVYLSFFATTGFESFTLKHLVDICGDVGGVCAGGQADIVKASAQEKINYNPFGISGAVGAYNRNLRGELEFNYVFPYNRRLRDTINNDFQDFEFSNYSFMLNGYFDFGTHRWKIRPYVGVGLGLNIASMEFAQKITLDDPADFIIDIPKKSESSVRLSGQGMLGLSGRISEKVAVDLGYKLVLSDKATMTQNVFFPEVPGVVAKQRNEIISSPSHFLRLGLRFEI